MQGLESENLRYEDVIWLLFLTRHLYLIGVWLGMDQRTNTTMTNVQMRLDYVFNFFFY